MAINAGEMRRTIRRKQGSYCGFQGRCGIGSIVRHRLKVPASTHGTGRQASVSREAESAEGHSLQGHMSAVFRWHGL